MAAHPSTPTPTPSRPAADPGAVAVALAALEPSRRIVTPSAAVGAALAEAGRRVEVADDLQRLSDGGVDALVLVADELSHAGDDAEWLVSEAGRSLRPGGTLVASALSAVLADLRPGGRQEGRAPRVFLAAQLEHALGQRGFAVDVVAAPGAAARVAGRSDLPAYDPDHDRLPGLLDAGTRVVVVGTAPRSAGDRSRVFFATLPRKVVAAATLCRDPDGRVLIVFDAFRGHWTIPGGVVDADEDPRAAAERETWEEAGLRVRATDLLGVFSASWPDRIVFVYAAAPVPGAGTDLRPIHRHEVADATWVDLDQAIGRVNPATGEQLRRSLQSPGGTWRQ